MTLPVWVGCLFAQANFSHLKICLLINVSIHILHAFLKNTLNKDLSKIILDDNWMPHMDMSP